MSRKFWTRAATVVGVLLMASPATPALAQESGEGTVSAQSVNADINGSGATFILNMMQAWTADFKKREPQANVAYSGVGSSTGRRNFCDGVTDFGASDTPFPVKADEDACMNKRSFVYLPITTGGVAAFYNLGGNPNIRLTPNTLGKIFAGKITNWNDTAIADDNPGATIPAGQITVVVRSDGSGTSNVFTSYMKALSGADGYTNNGADTFPESPAGKTAGYKQVRVSGSSNVAAEVGKTSGAIGYAETSFPKNSGLKSVSIRNGSGAFVQPTANAVTEAIGDGTIKEDGTVVLNFATANAAAYPISTVSYVLAPTAVNNKNTADTLKAFFTYANTDG